MKAFEVLFWISLFIVFYTYIGYGILLYICLLYTSDAADD